MCRSAKLSSRQRTVTYGQLYITAKTVLCASRSFISAAPAPLASFLPPFSSHLPPSSSPPGLHPLRSSVKFLTFVTTTRDCERARPTAETCGVFEPAGPPISPTSHPVAALKWGPSAECLCVCLPNPHKDLSLCHKFI